MKRKVSIAVAVFVLLATVIGVLAVGPFDEKRTENQNAETVFLNTDDSDEVNSSDTVYQGDCSPTDSVIVKSDKKLTSKNIGKYLSVESYLGDVPTEFAVEEISDGYYKVTPETAMTEGLAYDFSAENGATLVAEGNEEIKSVTKRIAKKESEVVELKTGIVYLDWDDVKGDSAETITAIDSEIAEGIQAGSVLCLMEGYNEWENRNGTNEELVELYDEDMLFVRVEDIDDSSDGGKTEISVADADPEDVYENVDVYVEMPVSAEELIDIDAIESAVAESEGTEQMTDLLAAAISQDETVLQLLDGESAGSTSYFRNGVSYENGKSISLGSKMLEGLSVTAAISNDAENANFPNANEDGWQALEIRFTYNTQVRTVRISAEVKVTQYLNLSMQGYKSWDGSDMDFDYAMNMYSQTNFDVSVLVCSTMPNSKVTGNATSPSSSVDVGKWLDISESIKAHMTEGSTDSDNIIARMQELLEADGGYIELVNVPIVNKVIRVIPELPVFGVGLKLNYVLKINFAAGISSEITVLDAVQIGMQGSNHGSEKGVRSYKHELPGANRYSYDLYAAGYLGVKTGFEGQLTLSFLGLNELGEVGIEIEVGAYIDCYGYLHLAIVKKNQFSDNIDKQFYGGYYIDIGIYLEINVVAQSEVFNVKAEQNLYEHKWSLAHLGDKYVFYGLTDIKDSGEYFLGGNSVSLAEFLNVEGKFLDLTTGETEIRPVDEMLKNSEVRFSDEAFSINKGNITVDPNKVYKYVKVEGKNGTFAEKTNKTVCTMKFTYSGPSLVGTENGVSREYKLYWADKKTGISSIDEFNQSYKVGYALKLEDGTTVNLDTVEYVEAGSYVSGFKRTDAESNLYFIKDKDSEKEYSYWTFSKIPSEDTVYTMDAARRQTYAAFVYFDEAQNSWVADIRILNVGDSVELSGAKPEMISSWTATEKSFRDGNTYSIDGSTVTEAPDYDLYGYNPNESIGVVKVADPRNISSELLAFAQKNNISLDVADRCKTEDGEKVPFDSIYTFRADYRDCNVTFYSGDGYQTVQKVPYGSTYTCSEYISFRPDLGELTGWDANEDGIADYAADATFPAVTENTVIYRAVYSPKPISIKILAYDSVENNYETATEITLNSDEYLVFGENGTVTLQSENAERRMMVENAFSEAIPEDFISWQYTYQAFYSEENGWNYAEWKNCSRKQQVEYSALCFRASFCDSTINFIASNDVPLYNTQGEDIESCTCKTYSGNYFYVAEGNPVGDVQILRYLVTDNGIYIMDGWDTDGDGQSDRSYGEFYYARKGVQTLKPVYSFYENKYKVTAYSEVDLGLTAQMYDGLEQTSENGQYIYTLNGNLEAARDFANYIRNNLPANYTDEETGKEYYFHDWELKKSLNGNEYVYRISVYKVPYRYKVTFDANGGKIMYSGLQTAEVTLENGSFRIGDYTKYANYKPVKYEDGVSWNVDYWTDTNGKQYTDDSNVDLHADITLSAHWKASPRITLKTSDDDIGAFVEEDGSKLNEIYAFISEGVHNVSELEKPTSVYKYDDIVYEVAYWKNEATGEIYKPNGTITIGQKPMTLTAVWEKSEVSIRFTQATFTGECGSNPYIQGEFDAYRKVLVPVGKYKVSDFPKVVEYEPANGYIIVFKGWEIKDGNGTIYTEKDEITIDKPIVFVAKYEYPDCSVTLTFDANGGEFENGESTFEKSFLPGTYKIMTKGDSPDALDFPIATREDEYAEYSFEGWDIEVYSRPSHSIITEAFFKSGETYSAPSEVPSSAFERPYGTATARWVLKTEKKHQLIYDFNETEHWQKCINEGCGYVSSSREKHTFVNGICSVCGCKEMPKKNAAEYYEISNKGQLYRFAEMVNGGNTAVNAVLTADIAFDENDKWIPMGKIEWNGVSGMTIVAYKGIFDGQGHTISGLKVDEAVSAGFVGFLESPGIVKNVAFVDSSMNGSSYAGVVVGATGVAGMQGGSIENCLVDDFNLFGNDVGSICGLMYSGKISNCLALFPSEDVEESFIMCNEDATAENCFYLNKLEEGTELDELSGTTSVSYEDLRYGKTAYLLANGECGSIWGHNDPEGVESEDIWPSLGGKAVYRYEDKNCTDAETEEWFTNDSSLSGKTVVYHETKDEWLKNGTEHYHYCSACKQNVDNASHISSGSATETEDEICTVCGYVITSKLGHIHKNHLTPVDAKPAGCETDGNKAYYVCSCSEWFEDSDATKPISDHNSVVIKAINHSFDEYSFNETEHWQVCKNGCGAEQNRAVHHFVGNICDICGYERNEVHKLTVYYKFENGNTASESYSADVEEGKTYDVSSPEIAGYSADKTSVSGTMQSRDITVTVTYYDKSEIKNFKSEITVDFKSTVILNAPSESGENVAWFYENGTKICNGATLKLEGLQKTVKVYSANVDENGKEIEGTKSDVETINVKSGFFDKLVAFFRGLFKSLPIWEDNSKK